MRALFIGSSTIDLVNGGKRCGGSAIFGVIPFIVLGIDYELLMLTCRDYPFSPNLNFKPVFMDECLTFRHAYLSVDERVSEILTYPKKQAHIELDKGFRYDLVVINVLFGELSIDSVEEILDKSSFSSIDLQGFIRRIKDGKKVVYYEIDEKLKEILSRADILVASAEEYKWEPFGKLFILTLGSMGAKAYYDSKTIYVPTVKIDKIAIGTGDMFISAFSACYAKNQNVKDCLLMANATVSTLLERIEFDANGCINYDVFRFEKEFIIEKIEERIEKIKSLTD